jgi:hypothetical protein
MFNVQNAKSKPTSIQTYNIVLIGTYWPSGSSYGVIGMFEYELSEFAKKKDKETERKRKVYINQHL